MLQELVRVMSPDDLVYFGPASPASDTPVRLPMPDDILKKVLNPERPFGPVATPEVVDHRIFQTLFDKENTIAEGLRKGPALIIGRRGSGKTAFLNSFHFDNDYSVTVSLQSDDAFPKMVRAIEQKLPENVLAEEVSLLWENLLWGAVFSELIRQHSDQSVKELIPVAHYLEGIGVKQGMSYYKIMRSILKAIEQLNAKVKVLIDTIEELSSQGVTFGDAKETAIDFMNRRGIKAIVLIDSLEQFPLDVPSMANTLTGLLRTVGRFNQPGQPCEIRCCLPSELYPRLIKLSSNPLKDVSSNIVLRWHAQELIHLAAMRYQRFIELYFPDEFKRHFARVDVSTRQGLRKFWDKILPKEIHNSTGQTEDSIAYVMRHTQLLPRHLLLYLNEIAKQTLTRNGGSFTFTQISVTEGIRTTEHMIVEEIFNGYRQVAPNAPVACKRLLPNLPIVFTTGEFHKVYNRNRKHLGDMIDYHDALSLLMEIGAVGVVTGESDRYFKGTFEYTIPNRLRYSGEDRFCIHPIFAQEYRVAENCDPETIRPVYPSGSEVDL